MSFGDDVADHKKEFIEENKVNNIKMLPVSVYYQAIFSGSIGCNNVYRSSGKLR
jgi:hypothetical protein